MSEEMAGYRPASVRLETERLLLCDWTGDEMADFRALAGDPLVMRYIGDGATWDDDRIAGFIARQVTRRQRGEPALWKLLERGTGRMIGFCGVQPLKQTGAVEIGWWLLPTHWGRGLATEAAREVLRHADEMLGLRPLTAVIQTQNTPSRRVAERIGLRLAGILPYGRIGGEPADVEIALYSSDGALPPVMAAGSSTEVSR